MKLRAEVRGGTKLAQKLRQIHQRATAKRRVLVGLPEGTGVYEDGAPIVVIGAVQEFGSADGRTVGTAAEQVNENAVRIAFNQLGVFSTENIEVVYV